MPCYIWPLIYCGYDIGYFPFDDKIILEVFRMSKNSIEHKTDKGFELWYWNLSYRRKFIRILWLAPLMLTLLLTTNVFGSVFFRNILFVLLCIVFSYQLVKDYRNYISEKNSKC